MTVLYKRPGAIDEIKVISPKLIRLTLSSGDVFTLPKSQAADISVGEYIDVTFSDRKDHGQANG